MSELKVDRIECEQITVKHPAGEANAVVRATHDGVGIWLSLGKSGSPKDGPYISIYLGKDQHCIGVYGKGEHKAINLGITTDPDGNPVLQVSKHNAEPFWLDADDLAAVKKVRP